MRRVGLTWRHRYLSAGLLALIGALIFVVGANADAGNPILGTIKASATTGTFPGPGPNTGRATITIYVRGQWNWLSHNSDCNFDRAATGAGIIWNDVNGSGTTPGNNEVQRVALSGTTAGATFTLKFKNPSGTQSTSGTINSSDSAATVQSKLEAMPSIGAGNVSVSGAPVTWNVTFTGALGLTDVAAMQVGSKSGGLTVTLSTPTNGSPPVFNGYLVSNAGISAYVGSQGNELNPADRMVHPVDRGNRVEGYTTGGTDYPTGQAFDDPASNNPNDYLSWHGGCGRTPTTATASKFAPGGGPNGEATGRACATNPGSTVCSGHPWGSWGYEKNGGLGYSHTYFADQLPDKVCVNFYDVHGGGTTAPNFQKVNNAKEITVDGNGDNSIDTNAFNVNDTSQGGNCISIQAAAITTTATSGTVGDNIKDTAHLTGISGSAHGTITFKAYKRAGATAVCAPGTLAFTSNAIPVNGPGDYDSNNFATTAAGTYDWIAEYSGDPATLTLGASTACGDTGETSTVGKKQPTVTTDAGMTATLGINGTDLSDTYTLTGAFEPVNGTITFHLYFNSATCAPASEVGTGVSTPVVANGTSSSPSIHVTKAGTYRWIANFGGDDNNFATANGCNGTNESVTLNPRDPALSTNAGPTQTLGVNGLDLSDSSTLSNATSDAAGTITFRLYYNSATCAAGSEVAGSPVTNTAVMGNGPYNSPSIHVTLAGTYRWIANYGGDPNNNATTNTCNGTNETVLVNPVSPTLSTNAGPTVRLDPLNGNDLTDTATLAGGTSDISGTITYSLYRGANCDPGNLVGTVMKTVNAGNTSYTSPGVHVTVGGQYRWIANYGGDNNNTATSNTCNGTNENVFVIDPAIKITKTTSTPTIETGGTASFHIKVQNTGNSTLTGVNVTDAEAPGCARTSAQIAADAAAPHPGTATFNAGDTYEYDCSVTGKTASFTNSATATGTPEVGPNVTSTDTAPVEVIHPQIDVTKNPPSQSIPSGGTAHFTIRVENTGDTRLSGIVITDAQATGCSRTAVETAALAVAKYGAGHTFLDPGEFFSYDCTKANVTMDFLNIIEACGNDKLSTTVCDDDMTGGGPPGCPEAARCGSVSVEGLTSEQNFVPRDSATLTGLVGNPDGKIRFKLYKGDCSVPANRIYDSGDIPAANGTFTSQNPDSLKALLALAGLPTNTDGTYNWLVTFGGDTQGNADVNLPCGTENFTVTNG